LPSDILHFPLGHCGYTLPAGLLEATMDFLLAVLNRNSPLAQLVSLDCDVHFAFFLLATAFLA